jgi:hypothetical protein
MATWQYDLYMIPRSGTERVATQASVSSDESGFDVAECWRGTPLPGDIHSRLTHTLGPVDASEEGLQRWGAMDGNRVDICFESGEPSEVLIRIDLRTSCLEFVDAIRRIASDADCVLVKPDGTILEPTKSAMAAAITGSAAAHFVRDPRGFLRDLADGRREPE